jgi:hypothetical protein
MQKYSSANPPGKGASRSAAPLTPEALWSRIKKSGEAARLAVLDEFPTAELHERVARLALQLQQLRAKVRRP